MTIKQLVPSLELCQRAQRLGWEKKTYFAYKFGVFPRVWVLEIYSGSDNPPTLPAPTLQEVLEELDITGLEYEDVCSPKLNVNPAEAALELWCEREERKVKDE